MMNLLKKKKIDTVAILFGLVFFIFALMTLPHYGVNWDTINHLPRGQAYLNYFWTGSRDYSNLKEEGPEASWYLQDPRSLVIDTDLADNDAPGRSLYQSYATPFSYFINKDGGHPPLSDILSSIFNRILFGKLRLINDIDSYRVYGIFLVSLLIILIYSWVKEMESPLAGLLAALSLAAYPLFWAESHFNTEKDIPEAVYWSFFFYGLWRGVKEKKWSWLIFSGVIFGLALGTKFNILFSVFAILPWLLFVIFTNKVKKLNKKNIKLWIAGTVAFVIGFLIFVGTWPYLWADPLGRIAEVVLFYKGIGTTRTIDPRFIGPLKTNTFPLQWILFTTPEIILILFGVGVIVLACRLIAKKDSTSLLFLLWFIVPVGRVVWPGTTIYGGVRQIMEYIPAMAIIAGIGGGFLIKSLKKNSHKLAVGFVVAFGFVLLLADLIRMHPYENVYFNRISGGLSEMKQRDFPFWGFSFGSPYRQIAIWLNENVPEGGKAVFTYDLIPNLPRIFVRPDIVLHNSYRSGYLRKGEYAISLVYQGTAERSYYDTYLEKFIEPRWEAKVDGVVIAKIWQNSEDYLKDRRKEIEAKNVALSQTDGQVVFDIGRQVSLSRLDLSYYQTNCVEVERLLVSISEDGVAWKPVPGSLPNDWLIPVIGKQPADGGFIEPFTGEKARFVKLSFAPAHSCISKVRGYRMFYFE